RSGSGAVRGRAAGEWGEVAARPPAPRSNAGPARGTGSVLPLGLGDALDLLPEQGDVERLLEDVVEPVLAQLLRGGLVLAGQPDDQRPGVRLVLAEVGDDLDRLGPAQPEVDDDRVRVEAAGEDAGLEPAVGQRELEVFVFRQELPEPVVEELLGADEEHLVPLLFLQLPERHAVLFEEPDELLPGDAAVLAAGDAVPLEPAGVEPLRDGPGGDLTDLGNLAGGEHLFHREALRLNSLDPAPRHGCCRPSVAGGVSA